ncbi:hypothetical protein Hamer_G008989 [Homarus americanus]|uniref:Uncharacterized protein n=1 Tax=Homarus americanus TaxID=6706 RepID=A0A8J5TP08_HOMAM|nr:hypothetical protein Hamer_G008989 [Homarus americanus]
MGCLLSVSSNTCVNLVNLAGVGDLSDVSLHRKKRASLLSASRYSSLFSAKRRGSSGERGLHSPSSPRRPGLLVADALRNLQRAHSFRHGECYLCNYKNKSCNGVCIHREIFTSVKPGYYSSYYNRDSHDGVKRGGSLRKSLNALPSSRESDVFSLDSLSKGTALRRTIKTGSSRSFKAKNRKSMRSITAFPSDAPPPELGIKPQISYRLTRRSLGHEMYEASVTSFEENEALATLQDILSANSVNDSSYPSSADNNENNTYEPIRPPLPKRNRKKKHQDNPAAPYDPIDHSVTQNECLVRKGTLTASDFGLLKDSKNSPPLLKPLAPNPLYATVLELNPDFDDFSDSILSSGSEERESPRQGGSEGDNMGEYYYSEERQNNTHTRDNLNHDRTETTEDDCEEDDCDSLAQSSETLQMTVKEKIAVMER